VLQILEESHLAKCGNRNTLVVSVEAHFLQCHNALIHLPIAGASHGAVPGTVDDPIGALADLI